VENMVLLEKQSRLMKLVKHHSSTNPQMPRELLKFVEDLDDPEDFVDLVAYSLIENAELKQQVLSTLVVENRFDLLIAAFSTGKN